jgi:hydroxyacylglutathione hydrolase
VVALAAEFGARVAGAAADAHRLPALDEALRPGDSFTLGQSAALVLDSPGHTLGHVVYRSVEAGAAFVGDTLFALGCGRLFEGTPEQMWASLQTLAAWPPETVIWCAHEYTAANARFTLSLDPRPETAAHAEAIFAARTRGEPTVPTTLETELRFNPFLRAGDAEQFAARRAAKDGFSG